VGFAKIIGKTGRKIFTLLDKTDPKTNKTVDQFRNLKVRK